MPFSSSNAPYPASQPLPSGNAFSVLVVEDQGSVRAALVAELRRAGVSDIFEAPEGNAALHLFKTHRPDLVLLDIRLPGQDGYWVAQQMRESEAGDWTPIIFLSGLDNELDVWRGIEVGGDDYLVKPVKPIVLMAKLRAMRRLLDMRRRLVSMSAELHLANQRLNEMVEIDALTGLVNRRGFDRILHNEILAARRDGTPLTLMLCDLDHFKLFNDASGHVQGDACLKEVGRLLREVCVRPRDIASRYGGEEFALILPNTPRSGAMTFARALGQLLKVRALPHADSPLGNILTLSGGITTCVPDDSTNAESMIMRADQALYAAKAQGRNRFFSFEMQMDTVEQLRN
ncbi:diguanylate cyclase domain-containing protein [Acidovorax facilis]|uniref:diguanylate cyclase n=1 Tax=Acidovorax facilis TaxID=12917 RepID=A0ABV8D6C2_9BURK|nr:MULTISPECIES: diguanylate cyclase [unclassified Acidovorax]MCO4241531.1 diguanylate cyclase [Acidovorax facilis]KQB57657.1 diguanylate cyclase [Acidovorax sp. SD340]MBO1008011.1 diguanylate cyclase [Acidovorax sp. SD340]QLA80853.1 diguanylate cyclase [Acidovorax sp. JMULE5]RKR67765.1 response regulator receiver modulated diguanylate cyclase [Acidovorax sp. 94]